MAESFLTQDRLLILLTQDPNHALAKLGLRFVKSHLQWARSQNLPAQLSVFFYGDSAHFANRLRWQSADVANLGQAWQQIAQTYDLDLPVCVSTALARGVSDDDNAQRHHLLGENLAEHFSLMGLGDLAQALHQADKVIQF